MGQKIVVVDDDNEVRDSLSALLIAADYTVSTYGRAKLFLASVEPAPGCVISDIRMPDMTGLELQQILALRYSDLPVILMTGYADVPLAVQALQAGATDFIEKPFANSAILYCVRRALEIGAQSARQSQEAKDAKEAMALLSPREQKVLQLVVDGDSNKIVAHELGISTRTVEHHRANIMNKMNARNISDAVRVALTARQRPGR